MKHEKTDVSLSLTRQEEYSTPSASFSLTQSFMHLFVSFNFSSFHQFHQVDSSAGAKDSTVTLEQMAEVEKEHKGNAVAQSCLSLIMQADKATSVVLAPRRSCTCRLILFHNVWQAYCKRQQIVGIKDVSCRWKQLYMNSGECFLCDYISKTTAKCRWKKMLASWPYTW